MLCPYTHTRIHKFAQHCYAKFICPRSHLSLLLVTSSEVRLKRNFRFRKMAVNVWNGMVRWRNQRKEAKHEGHRVPLCLQTNQLELPFHFAFSCHFIFFCKFPPAHRYSRPLLGKPTQLSIFIFSLLCISATLA